MTYDQRDALQRTWPDSGRRVKDRWSRLTDDDVTSIEGKCDHLVSRLQERYGYPRERAEQECQAFVNDLDTSGYARLHRGGARNSDAASPPGGGTQSSGQAGFRSAS